MGHYVLDIQYTIQLFLWQVVTWRAFLHNLYPFETHTVNVLAHSLTRRRRRGVAIVYNKPEGNPLDGCRVQGTVRARAFDAKSPSIQG